MDFKAYVEKEMKRRRVTAATPVLVEVQSKSGVSMLTLRGLVRGMKLKRYDKAKKISEATGDKVSVEDLCE